MTTNREGRRRQHRRHKKSTLRNKRWRPQPPLQERLFFHGGPWAGRMIVAPGRRPQVFEVGVCPPLLASFTEFRDSPQLIHPTIFRYVEMRRTHVCVEMCPEKP